MIIYETSDIHIKLDEFEEKKLATACMEAIYNGAEYKTPPFNLLYSKTVHGTNFITPSLYIKIVDYMEENGIMLPNFNEENPMMGCYGICSFDIKLIWYETWLLFRDDFGYNPISLEMPIIPERISYRDRMRKKAKRNIAFENLKEEYKDILLKDSNISMPSEDELYEMVDILYKKFS